MKALVLKDFYDKEKNEIKKANQEIVINKARFEELNNIHNFDLLEALEKDADDPEEGENVEL